ncbi:MAG: LacI family DNA-binding transcriptional regulator [Alistipes sp.]
MGVALKDIAELLNLSKTTVSWVLSGQGEKKGISKGTQTRVLKCARELSYEPNLLARSLNTGVSKTIGLILPSISDSFYAHIAHQIEAEAEKEGYSLMIASSNSEIEREDAMIRLFRSKKVDGMIIAPTKISKREISRLVEDKYPVLLFDRFFPEMKINYVIINNEESSYLLVSHLIEKGFRKIAIVTTNPHLLTMDMRREGYTNALSDFHLHLNPDLYCEIPYVNYQETIYDALDRIFEAVPDVDGFFFTTHILAIEALRYFYDRGIDVDDGTWGLACMHEDSLFRALAPKMNIAQFPIVEIGQSAVRLLLRQIRSNSDSNAAPFVPESEVVPCRMDFRDK